MITLQAIPTTLGVLAGTILVSTDAIALAFRTRKSSLLLVHTFSANPGNYEVGLYASLDNINYVSLGTTVSSSVVPLAIQWNNLQVWNFVKAYQVAKDNNVDLTILGKWY